MNFPESAVKIPIVFPAADTACGILAARSHLPPEQLCKIAAGAKAYLPGDFRDTQSSAAEQLHALVEAVVG